MRQETSNQCDLRRRPVICAKRVADGPYDACAAGSVQTHVETLLAAGAGLELVVRCGGLQLRVGIQVPAGKQHAVGESPEARETLIYRVVDAKVLALQFRKALPAAEAPGVVDPDALFGGSRAEHHAVAAGADHIVDEAGGRRPAGVIEGSFVQRRHDAIERVPFAHANAPASRPGLRRCLSS